MNVLWVSNRADEIRVEIQGQLTGDCVPNLISTWIKALEGPFWRRMVVDISGLTGYDLAGCRLLHEMYRHGTIFGASTPQSLVFLSEISSWNKDREKELETMETRRAPSRAVSPRPSCRMANSSAGRATAVSAKAGR